ncbi:MAG: hypothetical protein WC010_01800 [Candidatus Absconditabacterales bacterium]
MSIGYTIYDTFIIDLWLMNNIDKMVINGGRVPNPEELKQIKESLGIALSGDDNNSPVTQEVSIHKKNSIQKYIFPFSQRATREYNPDLDDAWESMETHNENGNEEGVIQDIDYIFKNYQTSLSFHDTLDAYMLLIHWRVEHASEANKSTINETLDLIDHLGQYEPQMDSQQKDLFWYYTGMASFSKAGLEEDHLAYVRANAAFDTILHVDRTTNMLEDAHYKEILYFDIHSLYNLKESEKSLPLIQDFLDVCGRDPIKKTHTLPRDKERILEILYIQGYMLESLDRDNDAIEVYKNYLSLDPDNKYILDSITYLVSKNDKA